MLRVLNDYYLVLPDPVTEEVDKGSGLTKDVVAAIKSGKLIVPDIAEHAVKKYPMTGKVVSFGDQRRYKDIKKGDKVLFGRNCYAKVRFKEKEYFTMCEKDILCVIKPD